MSRTRSWVKLDLHWYEDPGIEAAGDEAGAIVFSLFPVLLAMARSQNDRGRIEFTFRNLSHSIFADTDSVVAGIRALVSANVLELPESSERGAVLAFDPESWNRWNETARKAQSREADTA